MVGDKQLRYADLPDAVQDFLSDPDRIDFLEAFADKYGLGTAAVQSLLLLADELVLQRVPVSELPKILVDRLKLAETRSVEAAAEFVLSRLVPVAELIGVDVRPTLSNWGVDPAAANVVPRVAASSASKPSAAEEPHPGVGFSDPILQHRLELIVASYREGVRTREQAVAVLMRSVKTGGLELKEQEANDVLAMVAVAPPPKPAESVAPPVPEAKAAPAPELPKPDAPAAPTLDPVPVASTPAVPAKPDAFTEEDQAEVQKIAEAKRDVLSSGPALITDTKAAADQIVAAVKLTFATGELRTRFDHIIDARLRDVRDGFETRAKLEASPEAGGVGLSGAMLVAVMEQVEEMDAKHHQALAAEMEKKKEAARAEKAERSEKAERVQDQDAQVMAKRYAELTGKAPAELVEPVIPARPTAAPLAETVRMRDEKIDTEKVKAAIEAAKAAAPVVTPVMSASTIPAAPSGRPKVEDIRFERKLAGPIEELRLLTLVDFRRLSKDPKQAILKIQDKVELVGQEGYEQRIAAIRAWRESPLSREYVAVSREALLGGTSIAKALEAKRAAGEDVLTDAELACIVELNGILRF